MTDFIDTRQADSQSVASAESAKHLRICMLTTFYPPLNFGGDGIAVQRLAAGFARRGHAVTVVHDADAFLALNKGPEPAPLPPVPGVKVVALRSRLGPVSPLLTQQFGRPVVHGRRLRSILRDGFDVTIFHNISLVGGPALLREGRGITLYDAHEHWLVCPTHVLWRYNREPCDSRDCLRCVLSYHRPPQLWRATGALERALPNVDAFIAKSEFSRHKHHEFGFPQNMEVIPDFLPSTPAPTAADARSQSPHLRPFFLFVGRLERIKGVDDLIPAFGGREGPDLLIAGSGGQEEFLRQLANGMPRVHFLGHVPQEKLGAYYDHALALVVPSVGFETFGMILIEAFRHGTPVIARRLGPFPEIVDAADAGLLFENRAELDSALQQVSESRELRTRFATSGQAAFVRNWSEEVVIPRYLDLIRRVAIEKRDLAVIDILAGQDAR